MWSACQRTRPVVRVPPARTSLKRLHRWIARSSAMDIEQTKGRFGFHLAAGMHEAVSTDRVVQIYVKSSALSRAADLPISPHLMTAVEIDRFIDDAISALQEIRIEAQRALAAANPTCQAWSVRRALNSGPAGYTQPLSVRGLQIVALSDGRDTLASVISTRSSLPPKEKRLGTVILARRRLFASGIGPWR